MIWQLAWRNMWRRKQRTAFLLLAIAGTCAVLIFLASLQAGSYAAMIRGSTALMDGYAQIQDTDYLDKPAMRESFAADPALLEALEDVSGALAYSERGTAYALISSDTRTIGAQILGVDPAREGQVSTIPGSLVAGVYLEAEDHIVIGARLANQLRIAVGDSITLLGTARDGSLAVDALVVSGLLETGLAELDRQLAQMSISRFNDTFAMEGTRHAIVLNGPEPSQMRAAINRLSGPVAAQNLALRDWRDLQPGLLSAIILDLGSAVLVYAILVAVIIASLLNTLILSVLERNARVRHDAGSRDPPWTLGIGVLGGGSSSSGAGDWPWHCPGVPRHRVVCAPRHHVPQCRRGLRDLQYVLHDLSAIDATDHPGRAGFRGGRACPREPVPGFAGRPAQNARGDADGMISLLTIAASLAWRNLWRRVGRTFLTTMAISLAVLSMILLIAFMDAWSRSSIERSITALIGHGQIHAPGYSEDPTVEKVMPRPSGALLAALEDERVTMWTERVVAPGLIRSERENAPIMIYGVHPERELDISFLDPRIIEGAYLEGEALGGLVIGRSLAERLQVTLGQRVVLTAQDRGGDIAEIGVRVVGLFDSQPDLQKIAGFITLDKAQAFLGLGDQITEISYLAADGEGEGLAATTDLMRRAAPDLEVQQWDDIQPFAKAMVEMIGYTNIIWVIVTFGLVAFGLINTLLMAVYERMREFGLMQAIGMRPVLLRMQILMESFYLVVLGTSAGAALGVAIVGSYASGLDLGPLGEGLEVFGASQVLYPKVDLRQVGLSCLAVILLSLIATLYPAFQASRRVPIDVLTRAQT